jgi:DNA repair protein RadD
MLLRPRQRRLVKKAIEALECHGNTLAVAPTGAGKTIMLSHVIGRLHKEQSLKTCVVAHRDELTEQNANKFSLVNPHLAISIFNASSKSWQGATTFAMVQTLSRPSNLSTLPKLDLLVIDEAHHVCADSYLTIIERAKSLNPNIKLLGMTATPNRGDKKALRAVFSNICDQIGIHELIASGHLVRPKTFVMDVGTQQKLSSVRKTANDFDMADVERIMNVHPINEAVVMHWQKMASDRKTIVFCSTVPHAKRITECFVEKGIAAVMISGEMSEIEREQALKAYTSGNAQVIVNVAVLTEGWDHPPTSCVVLLRPSSQKSAFIQMVGRGLRTVNPEEYPGFIKHDCIILDFGTATLMHGSLEQIVELSEAKKGEGAKEASYKSCPDCKAILPVYVSECSLCGFQFDNESTEAETIKDFAMTEIDILNRSNFAWESVDKYGHNLMACGFDAWSGVFFKDGNWYAVGGKRKEEARLLGIGEKSVCLAAANDWMNLNESDDKCYKVKKWLNSCATDSQLKYLPQYTHDYGLTRYKAAALLTFKFNFSNIKRTIKKGVPK